MFAVSSTSSGSVRWLARGLRAFLNGRQADVPDGSTILDLCRQEGVYVPTLCHHPSLPPSGVCRLCLVEADGYIVTSCNTAVTEGMQVKTDTESVSKKRLAALKALMSSHQGECSTCAAADSCELKDLAQRYLTPVATDQNYAIRLDRDKCIACGRCVSACQLQGLDVWKLSGRSGDIGITSGVPLEQTGCVSCGQCTLKCPVGALTEVDEVPAVEDLLDNKGDFIVVAQIAPSTRITVSELFDLPAGTVATDFLVGALKQAGFDFVFDTNFTADLTIMEEATELVHRITTGGTLPMFTSCCPAWVNLVEKHFPELSDHLSSCRSPQEMMSSIIKSVWAKRVGVDPERIRVVSMMPCTAKKDEARRPQLEGNTDFVLTSREVGRLLRRRGIGPFITSPAPFDNPLGTGTGAAQIFGATGGVMEAALRSAHHILGLDEPASFDYVDVRGHDGLKEAIVPLGDLTLRAAVIHGLGNAVEYCSKLVAGEAPEYHFVEVMACPGGCICGGGNPRSLDPDIWEKRVASVYGIDAALPLRKSHHNPDVQALYEDVLDSPNSHLAHELLHTHYSDRSGWKANVNVE